MLNYQCNVQISKGDSLFNFHYTMGKMSAGKTFNRLMYVQGEPNLRDTNRFLRASRWCGKAEEGTKDDKVL